jgi:hypothetical protein
MPNLNTAYDSSTLSRIIDGMNFRKMRTVLMSIATVCIIIGTSIAVIAYGRGYRLDVIRKSIQPTGLIAATSDPTGAQVLIDGTLRTATNNTFSISPGWYDVTITKEGFQPWQKKLRVQGEIVARADAYLFPTNPSLSTLSTNGVINPVLSPDGSKLAFVVPVVVNASESATPPQKAGVWILDIGDRPLGFSRDSRQITRSSFIDFTESVLTWSPDSKELLAHVRIPNTSLDRFYLFEADRMNQSPQQILAVADTLSEWDQLQSVRDEERLSGMKNDLANMVRTYMKDLVFSPDESKIFYEASVSGILPKIINPELIGANPTSESREIKPENRYVYDIKEDRNYLIGSNQELGFRKDTQSKSVRNALPATGTTDTEPLITRLQTYSPPPPVQWLPTNRHLIRITKDKIEAMEYDATNRKTIYAGPFWDGFMVPWANASRILILTNLNASIGVAPNLYAVNLR